MKREEWSLTAVCIKPGRPQLLFNVTSAAFSDQNNGQRRMTGSNSLTAANRLMSCSATTAWLSAPARIAVPLKHGISLSAAGWHWHRRGSKKLRPPTAPAAATAQQQRAAGVMASFKHGIANRGARRQRWLLDGCPRSSRIDTIHGLKRSENTKCEQFGPATCNNPKDERRYRRSEEEGNNERTMSSKEFTAVGCTRQGQQTNCAVASSGNDGRSVNFGTERGRKCPKYSDANSWKLIDRSKRFRKTEKVQEEPKAAYAIAIVRAPDIPAYFPQQRAPALKATTEKRSNLWRRKLSGANVALSPAAVAEMLTSLACSLLAQQQPSGRILNYRLRENKLPQ
ncbi:hypothetical protein H6P81_021314 [Aristolochia fimbriata]|uniref:Uncharacterized protein n=1 Tax=Aristolochia fimbriata TaxID=158543 RepID=A0AAV7DR51_ARIFI|nr:hypothetical protein H6P81_021314 [Aristolochia fimbriata]